jgi:hypothetical protein
MDVPKQLFLDKLREELQDSIEKGLTAYQEILTGTCGNCYKGCNAYSFYSEGFPYLNLYFDVKNDKVHDIHLCHKIVGLGKDVNIDDIYFRFFEEDKVDFKSGLQYLIDKQQADKAVEDFKAICASSYVDIEDLNYWKTKYKEIVKPYGFNGIFSIGAYKAFLEFDDICKPVFRLLEFYEENDYANGALEEYNNLDSSNEKEVVYWVLTHDKKTLYFDADASPNWEKTGTIKLNFKSAKSISVNCSSCLNALRFSKFHSNLKNNLIEKYQPTKEQYAQRERIEYGLVSHLKVHGKYLDILPE